MAMSNEEMKERMEPKHLTTDEMKEQVEEDAQKVLPSKEEKRDIEDNPRMQREYPFDFRWEDGRGKVWKGKFTNTVPDIETRRFIGVLRAQLGNNIPFDSLDPVLREINLVIAHLTFSLTRRPKWAEDLGTLFDF